MSSLPFNGESSIDIITAAEWMGYVSEPDISPEQADRTQRIEAGDYQLGPAITRKRRMTIAGLGVLVCTSGFGIGLAAALHREAPAQPHPTCHAVILDEIPAETMGTQGPAGAYIAGVVNSNQSELTRLHTVCTTPTTTR